MSHPRRSTSNPFTRLCHWPRWRRFLVVSLSGCLGILLLQGLPSLAQSTDAPIRQQENQVIEQFAPVPVQTPKPASRPVYRPRPAAAPRRERPATAESAPRSPRTQPASRPSRSSRPSNRPAVTATEAPSSSSAPAEEPTLNQYILEFNRSPVVGNRFRLEGRMNEARLGFTRPTSWKVRSAKAMIRFQHSPQLLSDRSSMTVRVNGTSVGTIPLNRKGSEIGQALFNIPPNLIQNFNEISMLVQQTDSAECPALNDPDLWTEILPDSKLIFSFESQDVPLDFARYPYPLLDPLGLDPEQLAYLQPAQMTDAWLTAVARMQASFGRQERFRPIQTRLIQSVDDLRSNERLIVLGTPAEQPVLSTLSLPLPVKDGQLVDANKSPLGGDTGVLMLATTRDGDAPVLVATANTAAGVDKAVQFLVQPDRQLSAGQLITVSQTSKAESPAPRQWPRYLPSDRNSFTLADLQRGDGSSYQDMTVRGALPPAIAIDFRPLPDEKLLPGSSLILDYSYSPQINPRGASVEVRLDDVAIAGKQLTSVKGGHDRLRVELPADLITPTSKLTVQFILPPLQGSTCTQSIDNQMWATVYADSTRFKVKREQVVNLPDLKLLQAGFPLTAPQDLSATAIVLPNEPTGGDLLTLVQVAERLGRLSDSDAIQLAVHRQNSLPQEARDQKNLVGIGVRDRFPLPDVFASNGFTLGNFFARQQDQTQIQTLPDGEGVVRSVVSPWNSHRVLLGLTAQSDAGLSEVRDLFRNDSLFFQLEGDTALVSSNTDNPAPYDANAYTVKFLQSVPQVQIGRRSPLRVASQFLQDHWLALPVGIFCSALLLFGASQFYLNQFNRSGDE
ncbi:MULTISPECIES: cellulose biosynthesis cyclic di-GMP-binding regulatory protein BcsB [unclassified Leptolyngbya]|uniref:cellulose biosynthesis cyclic di-GMP-binding regulatory protein BcsB n=1 Tax=unclassified Leptolyngbya TaxID=2650499 RepID=UPI00168434CA|nr:MULTISPECIES: cellulose biosynthesis cyclic di-GMP-binding regulatory protein BcsB [unclassified Leptolyngbya]MBD1909237.1 cellulose biosynthesis cyclic di-GMP-binding regulatory protein BcsB [Leptolyngbya sp. FACHB-8]MBD2156593.1 cellulose biosynthesis cyclic di-GMP-binding regulatory protein BcsB [Leptolyngbya sp. FACHB-16]